MRMLALAIALALASSAPLPAQELPQWVLTLSRVKRQARAAFEGLPNYACQETIRRLERRPNLSGFHEIDTLRFEVAVVDGSEMFARAGAGSFTETDLTKVVGQGAISTGSFSSMASNLFVHDNGRVTAYTEESLDGRSAFRFDYQIPQRSSGHVIGNGVANVSTAVRGSYWADRATLDLLRIEEQSVDIPVFLGIADTLTAVDYRRVPIGSSQALLPFTAEMIITNSDGRRLRNLMQFTNCRQYSSESTIRFDVPGEPSDPPAPKPSTPSAPKKK